MRPQQTDATSLLCSVQTYDGLRHGRKRHSDGRRDRETNIHDACENGKAEFIRASPDHLRRCAGGQRHEVKSKHSKQSQGAACQAGVGATAGFAAQRVAQGVA